MWPMLLNMTRDDCRRTLRRLELEAYSNVISVFRAQGALEESTKKLLEEIRAVLHISHDRHSAEARRVANDEILATIAEQLAGPNTGLGWICEGRRKVPLMPRGIPQTMYTEIADKAAQLAAAENKEIKKRLEAEKLVAPKSNEEEMPQAEGETAEAVLNTNEILDELIYPPIVMEDQTTKIWESEIMGRKRKITENSSLVEDIATPVKNIRNVTINSNQKHPNLSQIYSKYSQPIPSKQQQSKHSYNQVGKVSSKPSQAHTPRSAPQKHSRKQSTKHSSQIVLSKTQIKKSHELPISSAKPYSQGVTQVEYTGPPNTFQASYAQSVLGHKHKPDYVDEMKPRIMSPPGTMMDSPTMQLLTQPATVPHELGVSDGAHSDDPALLQAQAAPTPKLLNTKPCHLIIKKRGEIVSDRKQASELKVVQKTSEAIKFVPNRPVVVAPSSIYKVGGKIVPTKIMSQFSKTQNIPTMLSSEKMIVTSKHSEQKSIANSKIIISSTSATTPVSKTIVTVSTNSISPKIPENLSAKGLPATDLKVSAKTFLLNPKSGQKMVVLPSKSRTKTATDTQTVPILHFKSIPPTIKLVPVTSQSFVQLPKSSTLPTVSKGNIVTTVSTSNAKIVSVEPIKTANMADIVPVKGLQPITSTPKTSNAIIRPATSKGNIIVVQKSATIGKALSFTKNGNDMSKIIMGKNVNQLLQASNTLKQEQKDGGATSGNVIVLELNNDQSARTTTMSKILESHTGKPTTVKVENRSQRQEITEDTPVLFDNQITEETCTASSLDSNVESIGEDVPLDETELSMIDKEDENKCNFSKDGTCTKDTTSNVTDWDMELKNVTRKSKDDIDKLNSLHLDLGMSSDSDTEYVVSSHKTKSKHSPQESIQQATPSGEGFSSSVGLSHASRLLLCQLQDEGSSSNDSSFVLNKVKVSDKQKDGNVKDLAIEKSESELLNKAKEKLSEKVAELKSQRKRIDIYSTAISSSDINLDEFTYLDESIMPGDEMFAQEPENKGSRDIKEVSLDMQLSQLLGEVPSTTHAVKIIN